MRALQNQLTSMEKSFTGVGQAAGRAGGFLSQFVATTAGFVSAQAIIGGLSKAWDAAGGSIVGFNSKMQNAAIGFETLLGSAEKAKALLTDLQTFARTTPFEFPGLVTAANRMLAFGFAANDILPSLKAIGDRMAATGDVSEASINRIVTALGQIAAKGRVQGDELLQLTEAGVNGLKILADGFGVTTGEMQKMIEKGLVPADRALKLLIEGMENEAPNAMERMSTTWSGATSNIKDSLGQLIAGGFKPLFDLLTEGANAFANFLQAPQVQAAARVISLAIKEIADGIRALFSGDFARAGEIFGDIARTAAAGLIRILDAAVEAIPAAVQVLGQLANAAAQWGFNLVAAFGQGMMEAASTILTTVMNEIVGAIAAFIQSFSPPKKGPLTQIEIWGTNLIETYLEGMTKADFGILDGVMKAVEDILTRQVNIGALPKEGLIPALIGSEAVVAQALDQMREFGRINDDVFGQLDQFLGDASGDVATLVRGFVELAGVERDLADVNRQLDDLNRQMKELNRAWEDAKAPIEDQIRAVERLYDAQLRGADRAVAALERQLRAQQALRHDQEQAIDDQQRAARLGVDQQRLEEAQGAVARRTAEAQSRVADAEERVQDARERLSDAQSRKGGADPRQVRDATQALTRAEADLATARQKAADAGKETAQDRLNILNAQRDVMRSQIDIDTQGTQNELNNAKDRRDALRREKEDALDPLNATLDDINDQHREAERLLQAQIAPLERQRDRLTEQRDTMKDVLDLELTRLDHARQLSDQYRQQLDLLNQMATAGAGGAGGGAGGLGGLGAGIRGGGGIGAGLGLKPIELPKIDEGAIERMATELKEKLKISIDKAFEDLKTDLKESIKRTFGETFGDIDWASVVPVGLGAILGGVIGGVLTGGNPIGIAVGAAVGGSIGKALADMDWSGVVQPVERAVDAIAGFFEPLGAKISPIITEVVGFAVQEFGVIKTWWETDGAEIQAAAGRVFEGITTLLHGMEVAIGIILVTLRTAWDTWGGDLQASAQRVWGAIKGIIDGVIQGITDTLSALAKFINGDFSGAWDKFAGRGGALDNFGKAVMNVQTLVIEPFRLTLEGLVTVITGALSLALKGMGTDFDTLKGHLQPVKDILQWLKDNVLDRVFSIRVNIDIPNLGDLRDAAGRLGQLGNLNPFDRKTLGPSEPTPTEDPQDVLNRALTTDVTTAALNRRGILTPAQQELIDRATSTRWFDQFLPRMTNTPITPFGVPQTPINDNTKAILRNTDALMHVGAVFQETAGLSTSDAGGDGSGIRLQQRLNAGGLGGLTATDIHLREGADVTTFGISAELLRASSQFDRLRSTMPGTPIWEALGFRSEDTFKRWVEEINKSVQEQEQRRNPVNDAFFAAADALNTAGQGIIDAAAAVESRAAPALVSAADDLGSAANQLGSLGADIDRGRFDALQEEERERARREREGGGPAPAGTAPLPQAAGGARITRTGALVAHKDEVVLTPEQQARFLSPAGYEMARAKGWITEAAGIYGPPGMGGGGDMVNAIASAVYEAIAGMGVHMDGRRVGTIVGQHIAGSLEPLMGGRIG